VARIEARGVELAWESRGEGEPVLLLHETATGSAVWAPVIESLAPRARAVALDRRGWGESTAPQSYLRTTIEEQSEDAAVVIEAGGGPAVACGAGIGAAIALDLVVRRPELVAGAVLIEPPLLGLVPVATEALSEDRRELERAVAEGGLDAVISLYLSGGLRGLGAGTERIPAELTADARGRPRSVLAEIGAVPAWSLPLARLGSAARPSAIVVSARTPPLLREAADALAARLARAELRELPGAGPAHLEAPAEVAELAASSAGSS
jgi:pimeloyl-ACP methyl ester carboxylesterase